MHVLRNFRTAEQMIARAQSDYTFQWALREFDVAEFTRAITANFLERRLWLTSDYRPTRRNAV